MKTEKQIRDIISEITKDNLNILDSGLATIDINAGRALMQLQITSSLDKLYWVLGEKRPFFKCDDPKFTDSD